jgi:serralysin
LSGFDRIKDLTIGGDRLDGPRPVPSAEVAQLGSVTSLQAAAIQSVLTTNTFLADKAATFSLGSRTFLALNDSTAGFLPNKDAIVEITGFTGDLDNLAII